MRANPPPGGTVCRRLACRHPRPVMAELTDICRTVLDQPDLTLSEETSADDVPGWDSTTHIALVVEASAGSG